MQEYVTHQVILAFHKDNSSHVQERASIVFSTNIVTIFAVCAIISFWIELRHAQAF